MVVVSVTSRLVRGFRTAFCTVIRIGRLIEHTGNDRVDLVDPPARMTLVVAVGKAGHTVAILGADEIDVVARISQ